MPAHGQSLDAPLEVGAQVCRLAGVADLGRPREHLGKQGLHLQPGQVRAEAEVRAVGAPLAAERIWSLPRWRGQFLGRPGVPSALEVISEASIQATA